MMDNTYVADALDEIADLLELTGSNVFRVRAYRSAARTIRERSTPLTAKPLHGVPGIGKDLAGKIAELSATGHLELLEELRAEVPAGLRRLLRVQGLGPKKVVQLHEELGIASPEDLERAIRSHAVATLRGFGPKSEAKLGDALRVAVAASRRLSLQDAAALAEALEEHLRDCPGLEAFAVAGSYRRGKATVGDLDLLAQSSKPQAIMDRLAAFPRVAKVESRGPTRMTARLADGFQIDLRVVPAASWGAALVYFTGSKAHNLHLRRLAQAQGLKISEYGVFRASRRIAGRTEEEVYGAVGLGWIPPELREDRGELDLAARPSRTTRAARAGSLP